MTEAPPFLPHYSLVLAGLGLDTIEPGQALTEVDTAFLGFLLGEFARLHHFDAAFYQAAHADIAAIIESGAPLDCLEHFIRYGYQEGRLPYDPGLDTAFYNSDNPDLARPVNQRGSAELRRHYLERGRFEGRAAHAGAQADAGRWARAVAATPYRLAYRTLTEARVQAYAHPLVAGPPLGFRGGLVLGDGPRDRRLRHRRGNRAVDSFPASTHPFAPLAGAYVYGGPYFDHFGHAMAEMVHRILPARARFDCRRLLFVGTETHGGAAPTGVAGFDALPEVMRAPLHFLGVQPDEVSVIHDNRVVEVLHVAQQGAELGSGPAAPYLALLAAYTPPRLEALHDGAPAADRIYVSRSKLAQGGLLLGERYLEKLLQAEGWAVLHPQELPLVAQMQAYYRAESIIFAEGSACHGTELFGTNGLRRVALIPRRADHAKIFETVLRPRAARLDVLPACTLLGGIVAHPQTGEMMAHLGVSLFDFSGLAKALRGLGLAALPGLDPPSYRRAARADLAAYIAYHRQQGTTLIAPAALQEFEDSCAAALAG